MAGGIRGGIGDEPLEIDLDPSPDGDLVGFRGPRLPRPRSPRHRPRGRWLTAGGVVAVLLIATAVIVGRHGSSGGSRAATGPAAATPRGGTAPTEPDGSRTTAPVDAPGAGTAPGTVQGADAPGTSSATRPEGAQGAQGATSPIGAPLAPYLAGEAKLHIYLAHTDGSVQRLDLAGGTVSDEPDLGGLVNGTAPARIVSGPDGRPLALGYTAASGYMGDGTTWVTQDDDLVRRPVDTGAFSTRVGLGLAYPVGIVLGLTADRRPVVELPDGHGFAVAPDGSLEQVTEGVPVVFDHGRSAETLCSPDGTCRLVVHGSAGSVAIPRIGYAGTIAVLFSPDGRHAVVSQYSGRGPTTAVYDLTSATADGSSAVPPVVIDLPNSMRPGVDTWSPDGRFFFFLAEGRLATYEVASGQVRLVDDRPLGSDATIIGVL